jgi:serine/threonine protein phosphatase PrpC
LKIDIRYGQATDAGVKPRNEDSLGIRIPTDSGQLVGKGVAAVIADGVSAAEAAREAADLCVLGFLNDYYSTPEPWQVKTSGQRVITALNRWLFAEGQSFRDEGRGFVCAMSALVVKGSHAHIFHVGDTRIWLLREGRLRLLTRDHCQRVAENREYLSRAMGLSLSLRIDYQRLDLINGDSLLLTTDGVHSVLRPSTIEQISAASENTPDEICQQLNRRALNEGSTDNVSCQLLRIDQVSSVDTERNAELLERLPIPPDLDPGMKIDGWQVEKILDASPRSQLYVVRDLENDRRAVMKTPSVNHEDDPAVLERFLMEEWIGRRIESDRVVRVIEKPRPARFLYYLMEHVMGQPLSVWIRQHKGKAEITEVVDIVRQLVEGLRALHRKEVLHQDLKPDNVLIDADGQVKIIDLGSTRVAGLVEGTNPSESEHRLGTARYSAPEYRVGPTADSRADLFSLAVVAYEMFTGGRHPWGDAFENAESPGQMARLHYTPAYHHNPLVPVWIDGALRRALDLSPAQRYPALSEFLADLQRPNPAYLREAADLPLLQRDPLRFWKGLSAVLGILLAITLWLLLKE